MATIREMIETHNDLARTLDQPELTAWKQAGEKLQARIDAMRELIEADAELDVDPLAIGETVVFPWVQGMETDANSEAQEPLGEPGPDTVSPNGAEATTDEHVEPAAPSRGVGKLIASLLVDPEAFDYPTICDIVRGEFPAAKTSTRSIASVAAGLRRKGVEVPMRRNTKG